MAKKLKKPEGKEASRKTEDRKTGVASRGPLFLSARVWGVFVARWKAQRI